MKVLFSLLVVVFSLFVFCQSSFAQDAPTLLSATDFKTKLTQDTMVQLVDVRTPAEFASGHIKGAVNINYWGDDFEAAIEKLDKTRPVLLYCKTGIRSGKAAAVMQKLGFVALYNLEGGYLTWKD